MQSFAGFLVCFLVWRPYILITILSGWPHLSSGDVLALLGGYNEPVPQSYVIERVQSTYGVQREETKEKCDTTIDQITAGPKGQEVATERCSMVSRDIFIWISRDHWVPGVALLGSQRLLSKSMHCLESVDHMDLPVVKLLAKHFGARDPAERDYIIHPDYEDGETDNEEEDVGWMYLEVYNYVEMYGLLEETDWWYDQYQRPPLLPYDSPTHQNPGYWRNG
ncbi:conserved hypothetical protein [Microsporum canis CBS 113480]|uniref:Uncharacterized protein n=1 Tax=Arthroderma otae (strain ATCC MYA-4605 / CBS 113480) TaxID=554155 RepID=C5FLT6_ARTOC|nr:conserved hypothetical protein [Microsporum canis CBS 113480]EEQ30658.1 conserved hypothetical protein [Microsporum canis CBS 113480]